MVTHAGVRGIARADAGARCGAAADLVGRAEAQPSDARLLSDGTAAVVVGPEGVRIVSLEPPALDLERLRKLHARLLAEYPGELKKRLASDDDAAAYRVASPPKLDTFYFGLAVALEEAGVRNLLDDAKAGGLPLATRVAILNDYGFWLSKSIEGGRTRARSPRRCAQSRRRSAVGNDDGPNLAAEDGTRGNRSARLCRLSKTQRA
jgi:hypothetical protein